MGTETKERTPSAIKPYIKKISKPLAGLIIVASQVVSSEQSTTDTQFLSINAGFSPFVADTVSVVGQFEEESPQIQQYESEDEIRLKALGLMENLQIEPDKEIIKIWLSQGGWPQELHDEALRVVFCESRNKPWEKSPNGLYRGLFGLSKLWFDYSGEDWETWSDPVINAKVAYITYLYDIAKNQKPWTQWSCKP